MVKERPRRGTTRVHETTVPEGTPLSKHRFPSTKTPLLPPPKLQRSQTIWTGSWIILRATVLRTVCDSFLCNNDIPVRRPLYKRLSGNNSTGICPYVCYANCPVPSQLYEKKGASHCQWSTHVRQQWSIGRIFSSQGTRRGFPKQHVYRAKDTTCFGEN